jgi:nicotinate phosphoribosyltransferase
VRGSDLARVSRAVRQILDQAALVDAVVAGSGGLDELGVDRLVRGGAPIDVYGVEPALWAASDAAALDLGYELVEYDGRPRTRTTLRRNVVPGATQLYRRPGFAGDVIARRDEPPVAGAAALLRRMVAEGRRTAEPAPLDEVRARVTAALSALPASLRDLRRPARAGVTFSDGVRHLARDLRCRRAP